MGILHFLSRLFPGLQSAGGAAGHVPLRPPARTLVLSLLPPAAGCFSPLEVRGGESYILGSSLVKAGPAPWWPFFDYLVDPASGALAGVSYAMFDPSEMSTVRSLCAAFDERLVSYGIHPQQALDALEGRAPTPSDGDRSCVAPRRFPDDIFPFRRALQETMVGRLDRLSVPESVRERAAVMFREEASRVRDSEHRVEILWSPLPDDFSGAGVWGCTGLDFAPASDFSHDLWLYADRTPSRPLGVAFDLAGACESASVPGVLRALDLPGIRFT